MPSSAGVIDTRSGTAKRGGSPIRSRSRSSSPSLARSIWVATKEPNWFTSRSAKPAAVGTAASEAAWATPPKASNISQASLRLIILLLRLESFESRQD